MNDVREVGAELHRLAEADLLDPFDTSAMIQRGRRTQRRRKIYTAGAAMTGVTVIALAATLLPNLGADGNQPQVAVPPPPQNPLFEPVPGASYGEAGADQSITAEDAARRCALRYPEHKESLMGTGSVKTGSTVVFRMEGNKMSGTCKIPGGDKPSAALIAAAAKDPVPATDSRPVAQLFRAPVGRPDQLASGGCRPVEASRLDVLRRDLAVREEGGHLFAGP